MSSGVETSLDISDYPDLFPTETFRDSSTSVGMTKKETPGLLLDRFGLGRVFAERKSSRLERVDRAQHLRVHAFNEIFIFVGLMVSPLLRATKSWPFLINAHWNSNIRRHAVAVNDLLARGVIFRGGKAQGPIHPAACITFWTEPFPKVVSPTTIARCKSLSAPQTISAPLALPSFTKPPSEKFGRFLGPAGRCVLRCCDATLPWVETTLVFGGKIVRKHPPRY